jgi:hypothetical protein
MRDTITQDRLGKHVYLGFGIYALKYQKTKMRNERFEDMHLVVLKPTGDYELLLDQKTFRRLKKFAKKYWSKKTRKET